MFPFCSPDASAWPARAQAESVEQVAEPVDLVARGRALFSDRALSSDGLASCASCHNPARGFTDHLRAPRLRGRTLGTPRTPSLLDAGRSAGPFFWNGRAATLEAQAFWPLYAAEELGTTPQRLEAHGGSLAVARALAAYVASLKTGPTPYDRYLGGDCSALSPLELEGARVVAGGTKCSGCHEGTEFRGRSVVPLRYTNVPKGAFRSSEQSYSADANLARGPVGGRVTLSSVPQALRNLAQRGPPWGRYGSHARLEEFLVAHGEQPVLASQRFRLGPEERKGVLAFLFVGLRGMP